MKNLNRSILLSGLAVAIPLAIASGSVLAADLPVNCDAGEKISPAVDKAAPGDRVVVSGTCKETVFVRPHKTSVTLDGQGKATIEGPAPSQVQGNRPDSFVIFVMGQRIKIEGFTILNGFMGVHVSGPASVEVANNVIRGAGYGAIHFDKGSVGLIYGNTIENNKVFAINLAENTFARVGYRFPTLPKLEPNIIRNNDADGIVVGRMSTASIMGNEISNNTGTGVLVSGNSQAEIAGNDISGNGKDGINVSLNSGVSFHFVAHERPESGNKSTSPNKGFGVSCDLGGYVDGELGALSGAKGAHAASGNCLERIK